MNIAICSIFWESSRRGHLDRYMAQIDALDWPHDELRLYLVEGDSRDNTWARLVQWTRRDPRVHVAHRDLNQPYKGSSEDVVRLRGCSILASYTRQMAVSADWADRILWIESDLLWEPDLLQRLMAAQRAIVAPWIYVQMAANGETDIAKLRALPEGWRWFYDTWAYRHLGGAKFLMHEPRPELPFQVESVGSCFLADAQAVEWSNEPNDQAIVGWCEQARKAHYEIWVEPRAEVWHPWPRKE